MEIQSITYRRMKNLGNFENETIEITSLVQQGDVPDTVLEQMRAWTTAQLGIKRA